MSRSRQAQPKVLPLPISSPERVDLASGPISAFNKLWRLASAGDPYITDIDRGDLIGMRYALAEPAPEAVIGSAWGKVKPTGMGDFLAFLTSDVQGRREARIASDHAARHIVNRAHLGADPFCMVLQDFSIARSYTEHRGKRVPDSLAQVLASQQAHLPLAERRYAITTFSPADVASRDLAFSAASSVMPTVGVMATAARWPTPDPERPELLLDPVVWRSVVEQLITIARAIVIVLDPASGSSGLMQEIQMINRAAVSSRVIVLQTPRSAYDPTTRKLSGPDLRLRVPSPLTRLPGVLETIDGSSPDLERKVVDALAKLL